MLRRFLLTAAIATAALTATAGGPTSADNGVEDRYGYIACLPWQKATVTAHTYGFIQINGVRMNVSPHDGWGGPGSGSYWHTDTMYGTSPYGSWRVESPDIERVRAWCR